MLCNGRLSAKPSNLETSTGRLRCSKICSRPRMWSHVLRNRSHGRLNMVISLTLSPVSSLPCAILTNWPNVALTPFHRTASGEWWTSANSRNTWDLGYTYPELLDGPTNETLISRINELYRDSRLASQSKSIQEPTSDVEYMVRIAMPVSSETSYNVVLFLGEVDNEAAKWQSQDSFVSKTSSMIIASAQKSSSTLGTIMLGDVIEKRIADAQLQQEDIVNHLKTNLHWRLELVSKITTALDLRLIQFRET